MDKSWIKWVASIVAILFISIYFITGSKFLTIHSFPNGEVQGTILSLNQVDFEPGLATQMVRWECSKKSKPVTTYGGLNHARYKDDVWYFTGAIISDSLIGKLVNIKYKTIDPDKGLFLVISIEKN